MFGPPTVLPIVNVFDPPFEKWLRRKATEEECVRDYQKTGSYGLMLSGVNDKMTNRISNHLDSAIYMAKAQVDNELENFIDNNLSSNINFKVWRKNMPSRIPNELWNYQNHYPEYNLNQLKDNIKNINCILTEGQTLIHGGLWSQNKGHKFYTDLPLSTSFSPQVALRNTEFKGKAYDAGRIDLIVLEVISPQTRVYIFRQKGSKKGHEKEVVFNVGAKLRMIKDNFIGYVKAYKYEGHNRLEKDIPIHVIEAEIS